jgi:hypothetical protein
MNVITPAQAKNRTSGGLTQISAQPAIAKPRKRRRSLRKSAYRYDFRVRCIVFGNALGNSLVGAINSPSPQSNANDGSFGQGLAQTESQKWSLAGQMNVDLPGLDTSNLIGPGAGYQYSAYASTPDAFSMPADGSYGGTAATTDSDSVSDTAPVYYKGQLVGFSDSSGNFTSVDQPPVVGSGFDSNGNFMPLDTQTSYASSSSSNVRQTDVDGVPTYSDGSSYVPSSAGRTDPPISNQTAPLSNSTIQPSPPDGGDTIDSGDENGIVVTGKRSDPSPDPSSDAASGETPGLFGRIEKLIDAAESFVGGVIKAAYVAVVTLGSKLAEDIKSYAEVAERYLGFASEPGKIYETGENTAKVVKSVADPMTTIQLSPEELHDAEYPDADAEPTPDADLRFKNTFSQAAVAGAGLSNSLSQILMDNIPAWVPKFFEPPQPTTAPQNEAPPNNQSNDGD